MAQPGIVYLKTNQFEVKLEGISFKAKDFESLCSMDFLFLGRNISAHRPVVGIDVMCHPRDTSSILLLLCFGVGCMIFKFHLGDILPEAISKFLSDERIHFVAFGIPEKKHLFPFEELGLSKSKVDVSYMAAKILNEPKYKNCELAYLARKILRVKTMIGFTDASSFERHEQIKCSICQLFITNAIGMVLLNRNVKDNNCSKISSFLKRLQSLPSFAEGWLKFSKSRKNIGETQVQSSTESHANTWPSTHDHQGEEDITPFGVDVCHAKGECFRDDVYHAKGKDRASGDVFNIFRSSSTNNPSKKEDFADRKPLKGILKCPSSRFEVSNPINKNSDSSTSGFQNAKPAMKRANSKGCNVYFK